ARDVCGNNCLGPQQERPGGVSRGCGTAFALSRPPLRSVPSVMGDADCTPEGFFLAPRTGKMPQAIRLLVFLPRARTPPRIALHSFRTKKTSRESGHISRSKASSGSRRH